LKTLPVSRLLNLDLENTMRLMIYDVTYTTKRSEKKELIASAKEHVDNESKPTQNLLF
jgi:hypothetical protein